MRLTTYFQKSSNEYISALLKRTVTFFSESGGYDFLKVDWCGGEKQKLEEETEYTRIIDAVKSINNDIVLNVCRWKFPGEWVIKKADSWRISGRIYQKRNRINLFWNKSSSSQIVLLDTERELIETFPAINH